MELYEDGTLLYLDAPCLNLPLIPSLIPTARPPPFPDPCVASTFHSRCTLHPATHGDRPHSPVWRLLLALRNGCCDGDRQVQSCAPLNGDFSSWSRGLGAGFVELHCIAQPLNSQSSTSAGAWVTSCSREDAAPSPAGTSSGPPM